MSRCIGVIALLAFVATMGCEEIDDQSYTPPEAQGAVNPAPASRDFVSNNQRHKILMAVVDSGTDYNHPAILNNFHFDLANGVPIGLGYDYTGDDRWPSPYVAVTAHLNPHMKPSDRDETLLMIKRTRDARAAFPDIARYFNPLRHIKQEVEGVYHGTHVAGLMVYDQPDLGLIPYRVLPVNIKYKDGERDWLGVGKDKVVYDGILQATRDALSRGVRVINFSLSLKERKDGGGLTGASADAEKMKLFNERMKLIQEMALAHPNVVFVAAAGNDGQWIGDKSALSLPCGVDAPNILCVGALGDENKLATFSNILLTNAPFVAAPGKDIVSLFPTEICGSESLKLFDNKETDYPYSSPDLLKFFNQRIQEECRKQTPFKKSSGTSMAAPIVARMVAKILLKDPSLSGAAAVQQLLRSGEKLQLGPLTIQSLFVERPSWYPKEAGAQGPLLNRTSGGRQNSSGWFRLFVKPSPPQVEI